MARVTYHRIIYTKHVTRYPLRKFRYPATTQLIGSLVVVKRVWAFSVAESALKS